MKLETGQEKSRHTRKGYMTRKRLVNRVVLTQGEGNGSVTCELELRSCATKTSALTRDTLGD